MFKNNYMGNIEKCIIRADAYKTKWYQKITVQTWIIIILILVLFFMIGREIFKKTDATYTDSLKDKIDMLQKEKDSIRKVSEEHLKRADSFYRLNEAIYDENKKLDEKLKQSLINIENKQRRIDEVVKSRKEILDRIKKTETKPIIKQNDELLKSFMKYK
jgi:biopolymer transport protein ExbB/TolQ